MASLSGTLSIATRSMLAEEGAMQASTNNLANMNTPGYSRQVPVFTASDPVVFGSTTYGNGVDLDGFRSLRDNILDLRIDEETQNQSKLQNYTTAMDQVQVAFSDPSSGVGGALTAFFNAVSNLTTQPDSTSLRQSALVAAQGVATAFHNASSTLSGLRSNLDLQVSQAVGQVNTLTARIASLNQQISGMQKLGEDPGTLVDQREQAINNLSQIIDVKETQTSGGISLSTSDGTALVVEGRSFAASTTVDPSTALHRVIVGSADITGSITQGSLGGTLQVRDADIPQLQSELDALAAGLANSVNSTHGSGVDLHGNAGGPLFSTPPASGAGAAALIQVEISDPSKLAMSSDGSAGGNDVANALLALKSQPVVEGSTPLDAYSQIVFNVGSRISSAQSALDSSSSILQQLQNQQSSVSGVSIDEETANLMQFQRGFEAAAHVITVVDSLMQTVLSMGVTQ